VIRQVGLIWVEGNPMLPMARAMLGAVKSMAMHGSLRPASPVKSGAPATAAGPWSCERALIAAGNCVIDCRA
jgi:hypothetical protein